jgi:hypothetical protein
MTFFDVSGILSLMPSILLSVTSTSRFRDIAPLMCALRNNHSASEADFSHSFLIVEPIRSE